jgi:hypothetical protein
MSPGRACLMRMLVSGGPVHAVLPGASRAMTSYSLPDAIMPHGLHSGTPVHPGMGAHVPGDEPPGLYWKSTRGSSITRSSEPSGLMTLRRADMVPLPGMESPEKYESASIALHVSSACPGRRDGAAMPPAALEDGGSMNTSVISGGALGFGAEHEETAAAAAAAPAIRLAVRAAISKCNCLMDNLPDIAGNSF